MTVSEFINQLERDERMKTPDEIIAERNTTHGDFRDNARISQMIKCAVSQGKYTDVQKEALDMIALKLSRIASGQAGVADHWADIAGYARLAEKEISDG